MGINYSSGKYYPETAAGAVFIGSTAAAGGRRSLIGPPDQSSLMRAPRAVPGVRRRAASAGSDSGLRAVRGLRASAGASPWRRRGLRFEG